MKSESASLSCTSSRIRYSYYSISFKGLLTNICNKIPVVTNNISVFLPA